MGLMENNSLCNEKFVINIQIAHFKLVALPKRKDLFLYWWWTFFV